MTAPATRPGVLTTPTYVPGDRLIDGVTAPIKLSSNESPHGPGTRAIAAYRALAPELYRYPDGGQTELRAAVAQVHGLDPNRLIFGNGSDELIQMLNRAYVGLGDEVVTSQHSFVMCRSHALAQGATVLTAPEPDYRVSVDELLRLVTQRTKLVTLASPNNPCGTYLPGPELARLHRSLPGHIILLVDAAYSEYATDPDYDNGLTLARTADNVLVTRTFSKLYGLAALRIGWGFSAPAIIEALEHVRSPFNVNAPAQAAAAAAVRDLEHAAYVRNYNARERARVSAACRGLGLQVVRSSANFVLIVFQDPGRDAERAHAHLLSRGIIPRPVGGTPANSLRITIGLESENDAMLLALAEFVAQT
jgi:histidinol-phosphate aminotransferase